MSRCQDPTVGDLLHAYELNILSEEDAERFEIHLLKCEHCFNEVRAFEDAARLLVSDNQVRQLAEEAAKRSLEPFWKRLWHYLWPQAPVLLRPGLAYLVILVMMVPAYLGLRKPQVSEIGPPQVLVIPRGLRSAPDVYLDHDLGSDGLIRFTYGEAVVGRSYTVLIQSEDGKVLYQDSSFAKFDERGEAQLCLPRARMRPGFYLLVVIDPQVEPPGNKTEYSFTIE